MNIKLTSDILERIEELKPLVHALNLIWQSVEISTDNYEKHLPDVDDLHVHLNIDYDERVRELAIQTQQRLFDELSVITREYGLVLVLNRIEARFMLQERDA